MARIILSRIEEFDVDIEELKKEWPELWAEFEDEDAEPADFIIECMDGEAMLTFLPTRGREPFQSVSTDYDIDVQL